MPTEAEPRARGRDVVGRALPLRLHQQLQVVEVVAVPSGERREQLEAVAVGVDDDRDAAAVLSRRDVAVAAADVAVRGDLGRVAGAGPA